MFLRLLAAVASGSIVLSVRAAAAGCGVGLPTAAAPSAGVRRSARHMHRRMACVARSTKPASCWPSSFTVSRCKPHRGCAAPAAYLCVSRTIQNPCFCASWLPLLPGLSCFRCVWRPAGCGVGLHGVGRPFHEAGIHAGLLRSSLLVANRIAVAGAGRAAGVSLCLFPGFACATCSHIGRGRCACRNARGARLTRRSSGQAP